MLIFIFYIITYFYIAFTIHIHLVLLLHYNNKLDIYIDTIKKLLLPITYERELLLRKLLSLIDNEVEKDKNYLKSTNKIIIQNKNKMYKNILNIYDIYDNICLFINHYNKILENFTIYQEINNELNYINIKKLLLDFVTNINFFNIKFDYNYTEENPNINTFINNEINKSELNNKKILCFTHGETLKLHFKLKHKLKNTEIVHYNHQTYYQNKKVKTIFNNYIIIDRTLLRDICGKKLSENKMFQVINKYFNDENYDILEDPNILDDFSINKTKIEDEFVVVDDMYGERYKQKYLKYKQKYLNYKKLLYISN